MLKALRRIEQQHHDLGKIHRPAGIGDRQLFQLLGDIAFLAHARRVDQTNLARLAGLGIGPVPVDRNRIAGNSRFRPGQQPIFAQQPVDQGRFARIGPPDDGEFQRPGGTIIFLHRGGVGVFDLFRFFVEISLVADDREQPAEQIGNAFAMLCRQWHRIAKAKRVGFQHAVFARRPFGLVGDHHHRHFLFAQIAADFLVQRGQARAGIDDKQRGIRAF